MSIPFPSTKATGFIHMGVFLQRCLLATAVHQGNVLSLTPWVMRQNISSILTLGVPFLALVGMVII